MFEKKPIRTCQSEMFKLCLGLDERMVGYRLYVEEDGLSITTKLHFDVYCHTGCDYWQNGLLRVYDPCQYLKVTEGFSHFKDGLTAKDILDRIDEKISEKKDEVNE